MTSLLVVNYRSASLAANAIRSARAAATGPLQVVIVDNSCDAAEPLRLSGLADRLIVPETNLGYAGGINEGMKACDGDVVVIANPDVVFAPGCIDHLVAAIDRRTVVAGPALFWDDAHEWRLPPGDLLTGPQKLLEVLASRSHALAKERDRFRFRSRLAFWSADRTLRVRMLSGAVMAVRSEDFHALGGLDTRFRLYFEETDFLRRVGESRKRIAYVPTARCRHLYNQSAAQDAGRAARLYAESEMRYLEKWNGPFVARLLKRLERPPLANPARPISANDPIPLPADGLVVEASPLASFATAAGRLGDGESVRVPSEVLQAFHGSVLYIRVLRQSGDVVANYVLHRTD